MPQPYQNNPKIYHSQMAQQSPLLAFIKGPPKTMNKKDGSGQFSKVVLNINGIATDYYLPDTVDMQQLTIYAGTSVILRASGDDRQGTAQLTVEPAAGGAQVQQPQQQAPAPQQPQRPAPQPAARPAAPQAQHGPSLVTAKKHLCQSANLMRCCVKKSLDIGAEFDLPAAHVQGIASSLFIEADRSGFIETMPIDPFTPQDLGVTALQARTHAEPEHQQEHEHVPGPEDDDPDDIPFN
jgi:hypothetical protein